MLLVLTTKAKTVQRETEHRENSRRKQNSSLNDLNMNISHLGKWVYYLRSYKNGI